MNPQRLFLALVLALAAESTGLAANRLILRDLTLITDRTVVSCDEDGAKLDAALPDGREVLRWDEIERGVVSAELQPKFDELLRDLGLPLLRLRQRLKTGDYRGLLEPAEQLAPRFASRKSETAFLVAQSLVWASLASGKREQALAPYLRVLELLRSGAADAKRLPGERRMAFDPQTGLSPEIAPVWFDGEAAQAALPDVRQAITTMSAPRPEATRLYFGTLALAAGDAATAAKMLDGWEPEARSLAELRRIALAEREVRAGEVGTQVAALEAELPKLLPESRPLAEYWLAMSRTGPKFTALRQDAALDLLAIPARYASTQPDLSAAAIFQAMKLLEATGNTAGSLSLARELRDRYPTTWHARQLKSVRVGHAGGGAVK